MTHSFPTRRASDLGWVGMYIHYVYTEEAMTKEYRAKVFKSGNSVALRLPKALGLKAGEEMIVREERGKFEFEPVEDEARRIDLSGVYGSQPGLQTVERCPMEPSEHAREGKLREEDQRGGRRGE